MRTGKISESILKRSILKYIKLNNSLTEKVCQSKSAAPGEDCAFLDLQGRQVVSVSSQPVAVTDRVDVERGIAGAVNSLLAGGSHPEGITLSLMLPVSIEEGFIKEIMKQAADTASDCNIAVLGGHTEVTEAVNETILTVTALGSQPKPQEKYRPGPGDDIIITGWVGMEESCMLAIKKREQLLTRYPEHLIKTAQEFRKHMLVTTEAATAIQSGSCRMHDLRWGGIFTALWEFGQNAGVGLTVDLKKIPIKQETVEIGEFFDINPYEMLSSGSLLIVTNQGEKLLQELENNGAAAAMVGKIIEGNDRVVTNEDEVRYLGPLK